MMRLLRFLGVIVVVAMALVLTGCASDVVLINPRTGEMDTCPASLRGFNPWSQQEACIGDHLASGWLKQDR